MAVHICVDYSLIRIIGGIRRFYIAVVAVFVLLKIPPDSSLIGLFPAFIVTGNCACFDITSYADSGIFGFRRKTFSASVGLIYIADARLFPYSVIGCTLINETVVIVRADPTAIIRVLSKLILYADKISARGDLVAVIVAHYVPV